MDMAISITRIAKGNFCTQDTLQQLITPSVFRPNQPNPPFPISQAITWTPPHTVHSPIATPVLHLRHNRFPRTPYSQPHTSHQSSTPSYHPTLFPIFLRCYKIPRHRTPQLYSIVYPSNTPSPYDKISAHLHRLHVQKKNVLGSLGLV